MIWDDGWKNPLEMSHDELSTHCDDTGVMFCEDCRHEHKIFYFKGYHKGCQINIGYYTCKNKDAIWSINGKTID